jgi:aspartyl/asparaginyl beta-hydroxylase (cupin superfamily)
MKTENCLNKIKLKYHSPFYSFIHNQDKNTSKDTFYNTDDFTWVKDVEQNFKIIKDEVLNYLSNNHHQLKPYFASSMINKAENWKVLGFLFWGNKMSVHVMRACPATLSILKRIPGLVSASISITEPYTDIKPHYGDTDAIYRCHFGIEIPASLPYCGFRVAYEDRRWEEGKILMFNDANYHRGWNYTPKRRIILILDVLKEQYIPHKKWICSMVLSGLYMQFIKQKFSISYKRSGVFFKPVFYFIACVIYLIKSITPE